MSSFELFGKHMAIIQLKICVGELLNFSRDVDEHDSLGGFVGEFVEHAFNEGYGMEAMRYLIIGILTKYHSLDNWYNGVVKRIENCDWLLEEDKEWPEWLNLKEKAGYALENEIFDKKTLKKTLKNIIKL